MVLKFTTNHQHAEQPRTEFQWSRVLESFSLEKRRVDAYLRASLKVMWKSVSVAACHERQKILQDIFYTSVVKRHTVLTLLYYARNIRHSYSLQLEQDSMSVLALCCPNMLCCPGYCVVLATWHKRLEPTCRRWVQKRSHPLRTVFEKLSANAYEHWSQVLVSCGK